MGEKLSNGLPKQWLLTSRTVCLLKLFKKKKVQNRDIKECDDCKNGHCAEWATQIDFRKDELPRESKCKVPKAFPCNKAYYAKEYAKLPEGIEAKCLPCEGILVAELKVAKKNKNKVSKKKKNKFSKKKKNKVSKNKKKKVPKKKK